MDFTGEFILCKKCNKQEPRRGTRHTLCFECEKKERLKRIKEWIKGNKDRVRQLQSAYKRDKRAAEVLGLSVKEFRFFMLHLSKSKQMIQIKKIATLRQEKVETIRKFLTKDKACGIIKPREKREVKNHG